MLGSVESPVGWERSLHLRAHPWLPRATPGRSWPSPRPQPSQHCTGWSGVRGLDPRQGLPHWQESIGPPASEAQGSGACWASPEPWPHGNPPSRPRWGSASWSSSFFPDRTACHLASSSPSPSLLQAVATFQPQRRPRRPAKPVLLPGSGQAGASQSPLTSVQGQ